MGKQVEINPDYSTVLLPDGQPHTGGDVVDLTDAEYTALEDWATNALTLLGTVTDPVRAPSNAQTLVVADESDDQYYRITSTAGVLGTEQIT